MTPLTRLTFASINDEVAASYGTPCASESCRAVQKAHANLKRVSMSRGPDVLELENRAMAEPGRAGPC